MNAPRKHQKGATAVVVAVLLVVLLGFTALAVDIGRLMVSKNELQNAADAAALAGANTIGRGAGGAFPPTGSNLTVVNDAVAASLTAHNITAVTPTVNWWDTLDPSVSKHWAAVQVQLTRTENLFFAPFIGNESSQVGARAVAVVGPPATARPLPFAVSYCAVVKGWDAVTGTPNTVGEANRFAFGDPPDTEKGYCTGTVTARITANNRLQVSAPQDDLKLLTVGSKVTPSGGGETERTITAVVGTCNYTSGTCQYTITPNGNVNEREFEINNGLIGNWTPLRYDTSGSGGANEIGSYIPGGSSTAPSVAIGDEIRARTGVAASLYPDIARCSCATATYNSSSTITCAFRPQCLKITVPVVNGIPCSGNPVDHRCPATSGSGPLENTALSPLGADDGDNLPIVGFACIMIRQVVSSGTNKYFAGTLETGCSVAGTPGGGAYYGVSSMPLLGK